ncbi:MAG: hypothetical protein Q9170_000146 [Blastenia crenularia]
MKPVQGILGLELPKSDEPAASQHDLRLAYRRALLSNHPDKRLGSDSLQDKTTWYSVDDITKAYSVLSDPAHRVKLEDRGDLHWHEQAARGYEKIHAGIETLDLDELDYDSNKNEWHHDCRCGDAEGFRVTEDEMRDTCRCGEVIVSCPGCSLLLKVLFVINERE